MLNTICKTLVLLVLLFAGQQASAQDFITQWDLAIAGSGATQLSFGTATSGPVVYTWQEISPGSASGIGTWSGSILTITGLPAGATIRLQIAPTNFQRIIINSGTDSNRLRLVEQWGGTAWTSMQRAFYDCQNLQITATDVPNLSSVTNMSEMFSGCIILNSPSNMGSWNTASVTDMNFMFYGATAFNQNISGWNTGAVTNMSTMFSEAAAFNQPIGSWNTGAVTDMSGMFQFSSAFNQNISAWNTAAVTDMSSMFAQATAFNQNIGAWNTGAVTDMRSLFRLAAAFNQNIGAWSLHPTVDVRNIFDNSGMDCNNYSSTLIGWSANPTTPNGKTLGAIGRQYGTNAVAARTNLISAKSWTITGDTPSGSVCSSSATITITQQPLNPNNRCEGQDFTFSTDAVGTTNITFQWQLFNTTTSLFENISDGTIYSGTNTKNLLITNVQLAQAGDYRCMIQGDLAPTVYCNIGTLTVNLVPTAPTVTDGSHCGPGAVTVSASGTTDGNYIWYGSNGMSEPIGENNSTYLTPILTSSTTYYVSIGNSFCESSLVPVNANITTPISPTVTNGSSCGAGTITLGASGGTNGQYRWYTDPTGSAIGGEVNSSYTTPSLSSTTTYYVSINDGTCEGSRSSVTATINPLPNLPTASSASACGPTASVILGASGGINGQYRWYTVSTGGTAISGEVNSGYVTPSLSSTTNYYVSIHDGTCEGLRALVTATINSLPSPPATTSASACGPSSITLNAAGGVNGQYRWYLTSTGGSAISGEVNSSYATPSLSSTTVYFVSINNGTCESTRTSVTATITGPCNEPPAIATTPVTVQLQGNTTIDLLPLLSDPNNDLDLNTLSITQQPASGAVATLSGTSLTIDYSGVNFSGTDAFRISICDLNTACTEQEFSIEVVGDIIVYNALSPGSDGKNDFFKLEFIDVLETTRNNKVRIYNRWGDLVWDGTNYNNSTVVFNGKNNNGKELPTGTYFYKIDFSGRNSITGFLSLKR